MEPIYNFDLVFVTLKCSDNEITDHKGLEVRQMLEMHKRLKLPVMINDDKDNDDDNDDDTWGARGG